MFIEDFIRPPSPVALVSNMQIVVEVISLVGWGQTASVVWCLEFLVAHSDVPGWIPGVTPLSK
jgi:hypothetical protein